MNLTEDSVTMQENLSQHQLKRVANLQCDGRAFIFHGDAGEPVLRVDLLTDRLVRVRFSRHGTWEPSLPEQWGYVRTACPPVAVTQQETADAFLLRTSCVIVRVERDPFTLTVQDADGRTMWHMRSCQVDENDGWTLRAGMSADEHIYGFGFQRTSLDCRGKQLTWEWRYRHVEATVPFFMSTHGYGCYSNNTWPQTFDFTTAQESVYSVTGKGGDPDLFLFHGPSFRDILSSYIHLTGQPQLPPRFAFGLLYIARYYETQEGLLAIARTFRERDIPCDMLGLEPGWEEISYSMAWLWSPERFPDPAGLVRDLKTLGYDLELWESGIAPRNGYTNPQVRRAWYEQRVAASLDIGVRWFKQDDPYPRLIQSEEMHEAVLREGVGMEGGRHPDELKNLVNTLYSETAFEEYRRRTGRRPLMLFHSYMASVASHRWPTGWAGDYPAGPGMLSAGLSGHALVSVDMKASTQAGIHFSFLTPFTLNDSWAFFDEPWMFPDNIEDMHRFYAKLRHRLAPYLYSSCAQARQTGVPVMRALVLDHPHDPHVWNLTTQHMLGDWLLVGQHTQDTHQVANDSVSKGLRWDSRIYLPAGRWHNYWDGTVVESVGEWRDVSFWEPCGGPLFVKDGAILPMKPVAAYLGEETEELQILDIFPSTCGEASTFTLTEDDGDTMAYEDGEMATTPLSCRRCGSMLEVRVGPRHGSYAGMPRGRVWLLTVHLDIQPNQVKRDGIALPVVDDYEMLLNTADAPGWWWDDQRGIAWIKTAGGWCLDWDRRGPHGDPERDTLRWIGQPVADDQEQLIMLALPEGQPITPTMRHYVVPAGNVPQDGSADHLEVIANPPQRVALKGGGGWLSHDTNIFVSVKTAAGSVVADDRHVTLEVHDAAGLLVRAEECVMKNGRHVFWKQRYVPVETVFSVTSPGMSPVTVVVRPQVEVPGGLQ